MSITRTRTMRVMTRSVGRVAAGGVEAEEDVVVQVAEEEGEAAEEVEEEALPAVQVIGGTSRSVKGAAGVVAEAARRPLQAWRKPLR